MAWQMLANDSLAQAVLLLYIECSAAVNWHT